MEIEEAAARPHDKVPNLKLVMNPEGKIHDWTDLPEQEQPQMHVMAAGGISPDTAHHVVESLESCQGRGEDIYIYIYIYVCVCVVLVVARNPG